MRWRYWIAPVAMVVATPAYADRAECLAFDPYVDPEAVLLSQPFTTPAGSSTRSDSLDASAAAWWEWVKADRNPNIPRYDAKCVNFSDDAKRADHRSYFLTGKSVYQKVIEVDWKP